MRRLFLALSLVGLALVASAPQAWADFGLEEFDVAFTGPPPAESLPGALGAPVSQAGSHPFQMVTSLRFIAEPNKSGGLDLDETVKDILVDQIEGFVGAPTAVPTCSAAEFLTEYPGGNEPSCPDSSAVGIVGAQLASKIGAPPATYGAAYNLAPPPGKVAKLGFWILGVPVTIELGVGESPPYSVTGGPTNLTQALLVISSKLVIWGVPGDPSHDPLRGHCLQAVTGGSSGECPSGATPVPFLTLPRACKGALETAYATDSWQNPGARLPNGAPDLADLNWLTGSSVTHDENGNPRGMSGCGKLSFQPEVTAQPTARAASSASGLDFSLETDNEGLANAEGLSNSDIEKAVVTLPEGMTANPSLAEGLEVCSEAQLAKETAFSEPGEGCPQASKIGTVKVETPVLEGKVLRGSVFLAEPYANPYDSLLVLYTVIQDPELGILVKVPLRVDPDPRTGQLITTGEDLPPFPFSHFALHLREGARSPLVTPPGCGNFEVKALLYPSSGAPPVQRSSAFEVIAGPDGKPCPSGAAPFNPGFEAGTLNNQAGSYSPFHMRLTRADGDQDMTRFSAELPPGVVAKLAGSTQCPEASIAAARARTGRGSGMEELESPSCPASSRIGRALAGAGVGPILTYVPGRIYLAGPYNGAPLSAVGIVPAVAGPFDVGVVVTRFALKIDPLSAKVTVDGAASDPIPHILAGIPLAVRDIRAYVDKPDFTLNPTSCAPSSVGAQLWGGGSNVFGSADDLPASLSTRFQAADCAGLGFKPRLSLTLKGGAKRGDHPALVGEYRPRPGDANLSSLVLRLPRSAFLDQAHIRTICTRVQFAADACPAAAIYGHATAHTPLLEEPLSGPVYLRSSNHNLPDFVADLHGLIDVEAVARIDSKRGGIRATFPIVPDAPLAKVTVRMQGAKKGLIVNSRNLCDKPSKANTAFTGHNGKAVSQKPAMRVPGCGAKRERGRSATR